VPGSTLSSVAPGVSTGTITVATLLDTDLSRAGTNFSAVVDWGDGSTTSIPASSGNGITSNGNGSFNIRSSHAYLAYGVYVVRVSAADATNSLSDDDNSSITVTNPISLTNPGTQTKTEGTSGALN